MSMHARFCLHMDHMKIRITKYQILLGLYNLTLDYIIYVLMYEYALRALSLSVEMVLVVQTMSYINYELLIVWPWQEDGLTSLVTSQGHPGFPGDINTPSPGTSQEIVSDLALDTLGVLGGGVMSARHSK
jgi:hypothetical protein